MHSERYSECTARIQFFFSKFPTERSCGHVLNNLHISLFSPIEWNFAKFLVNRNGVPVKRYGPKTLPFCFEGDVLKVIDGSFGPEDAKVKNTTGDCV